MKFLTAPALLAAQWKRMGGSQVSTMRRADGRHVAAAAPPPRPPPRKTGPLLSVTAGVALDAGLLSPAKDAPDRRLNVECTSEWVECEDGYSTSDGGSCEDACDGLCCKGSKACYGFTGKICKDNVTCIGYRACHGGKINFVVEGCNGARACNLAGSDSGSLGKVYNACHGDYACSYAARRGTMKEIVNSCNDRRACSTVAYNGGVINEIVNSCNSDTACWQAASNGHILNISNSCNGEWSCFAAGAVGGNVGGGIHNSCNNAQSCESAGQTEYCAISTGITNCCNKEKECMYASEYGPRCDSIFPILSACEATSSPTPTPTLNCENSRSWTYTVRNRLRRCNWVGRDPDNRCDLIGNDETKASDACKVHCNPACSVPHKTVTIPSTISLQLTKSRRELLTSSAITPSSLTALEDTIGDAALGAMDPSSQWVKDVTIKSDSGAAVVSTNNVSFDLILGELCNPPSDATTMSENVMSYLYSQYGNGEFTADLQDNAEDCGSECDGIKNATVNGWTFDEGIVDGHMCAGPWAINFFGIDADWSPSSENELVLTYEIGKDREYQTFLYEKDCANKITDVTINSTKARDTKNITHDLLTLSHSIDKAAIINSSIYNVMSNKIEICQIVNLIVPATGSLPMMAITEDIRKVDIDFDLSVDYNFSQYLGAGTTEAATGAANFSDSVTACKCGGVNDFSCNSAALVPNTQLNVCVKSVSTGVDIDQLVSMVVSQGSSTMDVIKAGAVTFPSITDMSYDPPKNSKIVVVSTFVPTNIFSYVTNASINISGGLKLELVGSTRKLRPDNFGAGSFDADGNGKALYELNVDLQDETILLEEGAAWMDSSGPAIVNGASFLLGMTFLFASGMW